MKFESDKMIRGKTLHFDIPFDPELLTKVEIDKEDDVCLFLEYEIRNTPPFNYCSVVFEPTHVVTITNDDVYWESAFTLAKGTLSKSNWNNYVDDHGVIGFHVKLNKEEKIRLLLAITKMLMK